MSTAAGPTVQEFLAALLQPAGTDAMAWCAFFAEPPSRKSRWGGRKYRPADVPAINGENAYYSIAAFPPKAKARNIESALGACAVLCDDVTTKGNADTVRRLLGEPSFRIKTSESEQWGYLLERLATAEEIEPIHARLLQLRLCDRSGNNLVRYGRLPAGINNKKEYPQPFAVSFVESHLERRFKVERIAAALTGTDGRAEVSAAAVARVPSDKLKEMILRGEALHESTMMLAARYARRGFATAEIEAVVYYYLARSERKESNPQEWRERMEDVPRLARTAHEKGKRAEPIDILKAPVAPAFTADDVPAVIWDWASAWARAAGFDPSAPVAAALVASAAMLHDGIQLEVAANTGWRESARLWVALIAPPGFAKTPAIRAALAPVYEVHTQLLEQFAQLGDLAAKDDDEREPRPALITHDATIEKLSDVLADNAGGIAYIAEELDSWLGAHDAYRSGGGGSKDRGEWLQLFDGGPHQVDRVKRGSFFVQNFGVSLISATTPAALKKLVRKLPNDGLLQRFVPVMLGPSTPPDRAIDTGAALDRYCRALKAVYSHKPADVLGPARVQMDEAAMAVFAEDLLRFRDLAPACGAISDSLAGHVAKYGTLLARLALTFHALEAPDAHPGTRKLTADTVRLAGQCMRRVYRHARVFYAELGAGDQAFDIAQRVARYLLAKQRTDVSRAELVRGLAQFKDAGESVQSGAMQILEDFGWVTVVAGTYQKAHATHWTVDERVHERFAAYGEAHRRSQEAVKAAIAGQA